MKRYLIVMFVLISHVGFSQRGWTGTWVLNYEKSNFNGAPSSSSVSEFTWLIVGKEITFGKNSKSTTTLDGPSIEIDTKGYKGSKSIVSFKLSNGNIFETRIYTYDDTYADIEVAATRTKLYVLSEDGKSIRANETIETTKGNRYTMSLVYDRQ